MRLHFLAFFLLLANSVAQSKPIGDMSKTGGGSGASQRVDENGCTVDEDGKPISCPIDQTAKADHKSTTGTTKDKKPSRSKTESKASTSVVTLKFSKDGNESKPVECRAVVLKNESDRDLRLACGESSEGRGTQKGTNPISFAAEAVSALWNNRVRDESKYRTEFESEDLCHVRMALPSDCLGSTKNSPSAFNAMVVDGLGKEGKGVSLSSSFFHLRNTSKENASGLSEVRFAMNCSDAKDLKPAEIADEVAKAGTSVKVGSETGSEAKLNESGALTQKGILSGVFRDPSASPNEPVFTAEGKLLGFSEKEGKATRLSPPAVHGELRKLVKTAGKKPWTEGDPENFIAVNSSLHYKDKTGVYRPIRITDGGKRAVLVDEKGTETGDVSTALANYFDKKMPDNSANYATNATQEQVNLTNQFRQHQRVAATGKSPEKLVATQPPVTPPVPPLVTPPKTPTVVNKDQLVASGLAKCNTCHDGSDRAPRKRKEPFGSSQEILQAMANYAKNHLGKPGLLEAMEARGADSLTPEERKAMGIQ